MLATFGKQRVRAPATAPSMPKRVCTGADGSNSRSSTYEERQAVRDHLAVLRESLPPRLCFDTAEAMLGGGANGLAYVENARCCLWSEDIMLNRPAADGDISIFFQGELDLPPSGAQAPSVAQGCCKSADRSLSVEQEEEDELLAARGGAGAGPDFFARHVLRKYKDILLGSPREKLAAAEHLGALQGKFCFVLHDRAHGRIVAARDPQGAEPLHWGRFTPADAPATSGLIFTTAGTEILGGHCEQVGEFPPGTFFCSEAGSTTGCVGHIQDPAAGPALPQPAAAAAAPSNSTGSSPRSTKPAPRPAQTKPLALVKPEPKAAKPAGPVDDAIVPAVPALCPPSPSPSPSARGPSSRVAARKGAGPAALQLRSPKRRSPAPQAPPLTPPSNGKGMKRTLSAISVDY